MEKQKGSSLDQTPAAAKKKVRKATSKMLRVPNRVWSEKSANHKRAVAMASADEESIKQYVADESSPLLLSKDGTVSNDNAVIVLGPVWAFLTLDSALLLFLSIAVASYPTATNWEAILRNQVPMQVVVAWLLVTVATANLAISTRFHSGSDEATTAVDGSFTSSTVEGAPTVEHNPDHRTHGFLRRTFAPGRIRFESVGRTVRSGLCRTYSQLVGWLAEAHHHAKAIHT
jgi:hypothetical protein